MFRQQKLSILDDYFKELSVRTTREEVYFYRISGYTPQVAAFIRKYYEEARLRGVVIEGRIPNPAGQMDRGETVLVFPLFLFPYSREW